MKKLFSAMVLIVLSFSVLFLWQAHQSDIPELEEISAFDPSGYEATYALQSFSLKPHDRELFLASITNYDAGGAVQWKRVYRLDENGRAYYMSGEKRVDAGHMPRAGLQNITGYLDSWKIIREEYDEAGRIVFREACMPERSAVSETAAWYYCPSMPEAGGNEAVSTFVSASCIVTPPREAPGHFDENNLPVYEVASYQITNYDRFGNETLLGMDKKCAMVTDKEGYLQMIVWKSESAWGVIRVDGSGRPLWEATYLAEDLSLTGYTVYRYELLS